MSEKHGFEQGRHVQLSSDFKWCLCDDCFAKGEVRQEDCKYCITYEQLVKECDKQQEAEMAAQAKDEADYFAKLWNDRPGVDYGEKEQMNDLLNDALGYEQGFSETEQAIRDERMDDWNEED